MPVALARPRPWRQQQQIDPEFGQLGRISERLGHALAARHIEWSGVVGPFAGPIAARYGILVDPVHGPDLIYSAA
jgi:hypothetical protein